MHTELDHSERASINRQDALDLAEDNRMEAEGLIRCSGCDAHVLFNESEHIHKLINEVNGSRRLTVRKIRVCRECAPRCAECDGLLDDASLFEETLRRDVGRAQVGMGVRVEMPEGPMHGGCAAANLLMSEGWEGCDELALLSREQIAEAYGRIAA